MSSLFAGMPDVMLEVQAEVAEIMREVQMELTMDEMKTKARMMWAQMPDDMKERFKQERPEDYAAFMSEGNGDE